MRNYGTGLSIALLLAALLPLCGCLRRDAAPQSSAPLTDPTPTAAITVSPAPVESSRSEAHIIDGIAAISNEKRSGACSGTPLLQILPQAVLTADGLMLDHAAGVPDPSKDTSMQAAIRTEAQGRAGFSACMLASDADSVPLVCSSGETVLTDTMAVHTGDLADAMLATDGGNIQLLRCDLIAGGSGSACLAAAADGSITCSAGTRLSTANDSCFAIRLCGSGSVSIADGTVSGDIFFAGYGNTLYCTNTEVTGDLRFDTAEDAIDLHLLSGSRFFGTTDGDGAIGIRITLDAASNWTLTGDAYVAVLSNGDTSLSNIQSNGFTLYYNAESEENLWLQSKTHTLNGGGKLVPLR